MGMRLVAASSVAALVVASAQQVRAGEGDAPSRTPVFVDSDPPHLMIFERTPQGDYVSLCEAPCSLELQPGLFQGAVSRGGDDRLDVGDVLIPRRPAQIRIRIDHGRGMRVTGWVLFGLGLAAGITSLFVFGTAKLDNAKPDYGWLGATFGSLGFSGFGLAIAVTSKDSARAVVSPAVAASSRRAPSVGPTLAFAF